MSALSLLQHPESWSTGQHRADGMMVPSCLAIPVLGKMGAKLPAKALQLLSPSSHQQLLWLAVEMHEGFIKENYANDTVKVLTKIPVLRYLAALAALHYL